MPSPFPSPALVASCSPRERTLLAEVQLHAVEASTDPWFDVGYDLLDAYFGARGELEARVDLARVVDVPPVHAGVCVAYPFLVVTSRGGDVLTVASRYVTFEPATGVFAALDGCAHTSDGARGRGLARLALPLVEALGRRRLAPAGAEGARRVLDVGDLERLDPADPDAVGRAVAWGRLGAAVIPPDVFPLRLLGLRDPTAPDGRSGPVPIFALLRDPGGMAPTRIDKGSLHVLARHLEAAHAWVGDAEALAAETARLRAAVDRAPTDPVPLVPLPTRADDHTRLDRLFRLSATGW